MAKNLSLFTLFITFLLLILGGVVHNTESSLACPDWPLCYGQFFPPMEGGILIEHSHRLLASFVGLLTIFLVVVTKKNSKDDPKAFKLSVIALVMVIVQGILGGITVIYKLPTIVSTSHLGLSMIYFCTLCLIHHHLVKAKFISTLVNERIASLKHVWTPTFRVALIVAIISTYLQIILGAFIRHSGASAACGFGSSNVLKCFDSQFWVATWWPSVAQGQVHMTHRLFAFVVSGIILYACCKFVRILFTQENLDHKFKWQLGLIGFLPIVFVLTQVAMGLATVATSMSIIPTTAHLAFAALTLVSLWNFYLKIEEIEKVLYGKKLDNLFSDLMDLCKPKLAGLVMVTVSIGMLLAPGHIYFFKGLLALLATGFVVCGSCALNCYIERDIDKKMDRTKSRPLPAGRLNPFYAKVFGILLTAIGLLILVLNVHPLSGLLAGIASILYLFVYTPMKTRSPLALFVGAVPGAIPPLIGWTAVTGNLDLLAGVLFLIVFVWQIPHFLSLSILYFNDYRSARIQVFPQSWGIKVTKRNILYSTVVLVWLSLLPEKLIPLDAIYKYLVCIMGVGIIGISVWGNMAERKSDQDQYWARSYFYATLVYLPVIFVSMIFFK